MSQFVDCVSCLKEARYVVHIRPKFRGPGTYGGLLDGTNTRNLCQEDTEQLKQSSRIEVVHITAI